jgi:hypothetical protein
MKRLLISIIGILLIRTAAFGQSNMDSLAKFHPLQIGNKWIYRAIRPFIPGFQMADTIIVTREIIKDTVISGVTFRVVKEIGGKFNGQHAERYDSMTGNFYSGPSLYDSTIINSTHTFFSNSRMIYDRTITDTLFGQTISERLIHANLTGTQMSWKYGYGIGLVSYNWYDILPDAEENGTLLYAIIQGVEHGVLLSVDKDADLSRSYKLQQNFPNPFNPSTTISFNLPSRSFVTLKIFDVMGREVSTIVSGEMQAGYYLRQWNASGYPSGVYFYRLQAGAFTETKHLLLLR